MEPARDAWELVERMWVKKPGFITLPIDPFEISDRLGIKTWSDDTLPPDIAGILRKEADFKEPEIFLNDDDSRERNRFTCAHALGHHIRNVEIGNYGVWEIVEGRDLFAAELRDCDNIYATEFATEMLMPRPVLVEIAGSPTVTSLAGRFGVTADVMQFRLDQIGWRR
jgi:Zn-dependent peptidase ImmA (M78 family)